MKIKPVTNTDPLFTSEHWFGGLTIFILICLGATFISNEVLTTLQNLLIAIGLLLFSAFLCVKFGKTKFLTISTPFTLGILALLTSVAGFGYAFFEMIESFSQYLNTEVYERILSHNLNLHILIFSMFLCLVLFISYILSWIKTGPVLKINLTGPSKKFHSDIIELSDEEGNTYVVGKSGKGMSFLDRNRK